MRPRKQHSRREIQGYKPDVRKLLKYGTELELMRFCVGSGYSTKTLVLRCRERLPRIEEGETLRARSCNSLRLASATAGGKVSSCSLMIFATTSVALSSFDFLLAIGLTE